jgi:hypothetical protein
VGSSASHISSVRNSHRLTPSHTAARSLFLIGQKVA